MCLVFFCQPQAPTVASHTEYLLTKVKVSHVGMRVVARQLLAVCLLRLRAAYQFLFEEPHLWLPSLHSLIKLPSSLHQSACVFMRVHEGECTLNLNRRKSLSQMCSYRVPSLVLGHLWSALRWGRAHEWLCERVRKACLVACVAHQSSGWALNHCQSSSSSSTEKHRVYQSSCLNPPLPATRIHLCGSWWTAVHSETGWAAWSPVWLAGWLSAQSTRWIRYCAAKWKP